MEEIAHLATPIDINLPNAEWIRERYGSKSVTLDNLHMLMIWLPAIRECWKNLPVVRKKNGWLVNLVLWGAVCILICMNVWGHGSGKMLPGVTTEALRNYYSTIEEARLTYLPFIISWTLSWWNWGFFLLQNLQKPSTIVTSGMG